MKSLIDAIADMHLVASAYEQASREVWASLLSKHPEVLDLLTELGIPETKASTWFCSSHFDRGTRCAAELFAEGRGDEVATRIRQIVHGIYP